MCAFWSWHARLDGRLASSDCGGMNRGDMIFNYNRLKTKGILDLPSIGKMRGTFFALRFYSMMKSKKGSPPAQRAQYYSPPSKV